MVEEGVVLCSRAREREISEQERGQFGLFVMVKRGVEHYSEKKKKKKRKEDGRLRKTEKIILLK